MHSLAGTMNSAGTGSMRLHEQYKCSPSDPRRRANTTVHWLPCAAFVLMQGTILTTYTMAVMWEHVTPTVPYVSETGNLPPESCVFSQFINLVVVLLISTLYVRYRQIQEFCRLRPQSPVSPRANRVSAVIGLIGLIGLDIVANFQQANVFQVHMAGAIANFSSGTVYFCMQTRLTRQMLPEIGCVCMYYLRLALCSMCVVFTLVTIAAGGMSIRLFTGTDQAKWAPEDGGYELHVTSSVAEWLLVLCYSLFTLAFVQEFRHIVVHAPTLTLTNMLPDTILEITNVIKNV